MAVNFSFGHIFDIRSLLCFYWLYVNSLILKMETNKILYRNVERFDMELVE